MSLPRRSGASLFAVVILALVFGGVGGVVGGYLIASRSGGPATAATPVAISGRGLAAPGPTRPSGGSATPGSGGEIVSAVKTAGPAVVKVLATTVVEPSIFDLFSGRMPQERASIGSGFIFDYDGKRYVLTNAHVVGQATGVRVKLPEGRTLEAKVVGADRQKDIALLDIANAPADLPTVALGDSDALEVGQWVIAMGNPYDYEHTVTVGVVSARGYRQIAPNDSRDVIQTDAAINSGNSGGPLLDLGGNVVGINFAIFSPTQTNVGIGFAIPINQAKEMLHFLVYGGPWIGIEDRIIPNSRGFASHYGLGTSKGIVIIGRPINGSPAAKAGLQPGDIILSIDGAPTSGLEELRKAILAHNIGDTIKLTVQRGGDVRAVDVAAGRVPQGYY